MANLGQSSVLLRYRTGSNRSECIADSYVHDSQTCPACSSIRSTDDECRACSPCSRGSSAASVCAECRTASGAPSHRSPNRCRASLCRLLSLFSFVQFVFKIKRDTLSDVPHVVCANAIRQSMSVTMATCNAGRWAKQGYRYQFSELGYSQTLQL